MSDLFNIEVVVVLLIVVIILQLLLSYLKKDPAEMWSPMTMISGVYIYYCLVGPIKTLVGGDLMFRGINHAPYLLDAWIGALLSYVATWIGFIVYNKKITQSETTTQNVDLTKRAQRVFVILLVILLVFLGPNFMAKVSFWDSQDDMSVEGGYSGALSGYLMQSVVCFVAASMLAFISFLNKKGVIWFLIIFGIAFSLFVNAGFRWRLIVLSYSLLSVYHLHINRRLNLKLVLGLLFPLLLLMGAMEIARSYDRGINMDRLDGVQTSELLDNSTTEAACFLASGLVIDEYLNQYKFSNFDFLINAIASPIPRVLWQNKPDGSYLIEPIMNLYGGQNKGMGQAVLHYAEYYMAFGWYGIILIPFFMGMILKRFWLWYKANRRNDYAIILISIVNAMLYVWVSRGYFSQFVTLFVIACLPIWILYKNHKKNSDLSVTNNVSK